MPTSMSEYVRICTTQLRPLQRLCLIKIILLCTNCRAGEVVWKKKVAWVAKLYYKSGRTTAEVLGANIKQVSAKPNYSRDTTIATYSLRHIHS